jgi:hypothetical protein
MPISVDQTHLTRRKIYCKSRGGESIFAAAIFAYGYFDDRYSPSSWRRTLMLHRQTAAVPEPSGHDAYSLPPDDAGWLVRSARQTCLGSDAHRYTCPPDHAHAGRQPSTRLTWRLPHTSRIRISGTAPYNVQDTNRTTEAENVNWLCPDTAHRSAGWTCCPRTRSACRWC